MSGNDNLFWEDLFKEIKEQTSDGKVTYEQFVNCMTQVQNSRVKGMLDLINNSLKSRLKREIQR